MKERIVEMRQAGYTWKQIDQMLFPEKEVRKGGATYSGDLAVANKAEMAGAFVKRVYGAFTNHQIVETLRASNPFAKQEVTQVAEMFI